MEGQCEGGDEVDSFNLLTNIISLHKYYRRLGWNCFTKSGRIGNPHSQEIIKNPNRNQSFGI